MSQPAGPGADSPGSREESPVIRVESGNPTAEEIAVLVVVLAGAAATDADPEPTTRRSPWSDPGWRLVGPRTQRRGWRASGLPR